MTEGEEAGIKSVTIAINGRYAFGYLRSEKGVHRLVRLSPLIRPTGAIPSFALVEVLPQIAFDSPEVQIDPSDLKVDVFRLRVREGRMFKRMQLLFGSHIFQAGLW